MWKRGKHINLLKKEYNVQTCLRYSYLNKRFKEYYIVCKANQNMILNMVHVCKVSYCFLKLLKYDRVN